MRKLLLGLLIPAFLMSCGDDQTGPQDIPTNLRTLSIAATAATISWNPPLDNRLVITNYRIRIANAGETNTTIFSSTMETSIRLTNLTPSSAYTIFVDAQDNDGILHLPGSSLDFSTGLAGWQPAGNTGISTGMADSLSLTIYNGSLCLAYADQDIGYGAVVKQLSDNSWAAISSSNLSTGAAEGIVVTGADNLTISFRDSGKTNRGTSLLYNDSDWNSTGAFSASTADAIAAISAPGILYTAFSDAGDGGRLVVKCFSNETWSTIGSNASIGAVDFVTLALHNGILYTAFADGNDGWKAHLIRFTGSAWETVASGLSSGDTEYLSLIFINSVPYLAFCDGGNGYKATVTSPGTGSTWTTLGGGPASSGAAEFITLGNFLGQPALAYMDNAAGDKANVQHFNGTSWDYLGSAGCTASDIDGLSFTILHNIPYLAVSDGSLGYKASVYRFNE